jgi:ubiquinone/menaquinone biosynthesis C-methylase UbiE
VTTAVPARIRWALELLDVQPDDWLLELGCGSGVAVSLACETLREGQIVAIDRSPAMVDRAVRRNEPHVVSGRAAILLGEVTTLDLPEGGFTKLLAINVNLFWTRSPAPELGRIARLLAPGGLLTLVYEVPSAARATAIAETVRAQLVSAGFGGVRGVGSPPAVRHGVAVVATSAAKDASAAPRRPRPRSRRGRGT